MIPSFLRSRLSDAGKGRGGAQAGPLRLSNRHAPRGGGPADAAAPTRGTPLMIPRPRRLVGVAPSRATSCPRRTPRARRRSTRSRRRSRRGSEEASGSRRRRPSRGASSGTLEAGAGGGAPEGPGSGVSDFSASVRRSGRRGVWGSTSESESKGDPSRRDGPAQVPLHTPALCTWRVDVPHHRQVRRHGWVPGMGPIRPESLSCFETTGSYGGL